MKHIKIPSFLLSEEYTVALKLKQQPFIFIIPRHILQKYEIDSADLSFDLAVLNNKLTLVGPTVSSQRVTQSRSFGEITI